MRLTADDRVKARQVARAPAAAWPRGARTLPRRLARMARTGVATDADIVISLKALLRYAVWK